MTREYHVAARNGAALLLAALGLSGAPHHELAEGPVQVAATLSEWKVELSQGTIAAGTVRFAVTNAGSIPHGFAVEGRGIEKAIETIQPGQSDTLTLSLKPGTYEVYCPVGQDSHKKLGMETHLQVVSARGSGSPGYGAAEMGASHAPAVAVQAIRVTGGGPVIQILPGPFPFPDSAAPILQAFGDEREGLESQVKNGPYSNNVAPSSGSFTFTAWDKGATRDALVSASAMVHVMLLARTRRDGDFALACWDCSKNKIEELQLQILPGPGEPKFDAPGGFLFVNWEKSGSRKAS